MRFNGDLTDDLLVRDNEGSGQGHKGQDISELHIDNGGLEVLFEGRKMCERNGDQTPSSLLGCRIRAWRCQNALRHCHSALRANFRPEDPTSVRIKS